MGLKQTKNWTYTPLKAKIPIFSCKWSEVKIVYLPIQIKMGGQAQSPNFSQIVNGTQVHY